jgi:hypothetical protein
MTRAVVALAIIRCGLRAQNHQLTTNRKMKKRSSSSFDRKSLVRVD